MKTQAIDGSRKSTRCGSGEVAARATDGYARLLERLGVVRTIERGDDRILVWCRQPVASLAAC